MRVIKTISKKKFTLKFSKWELNPISFTQACNIPHESCKPLDLNKFFYEFEKKHGLLFLILLYLDTFLSYGY